MFGCLAMARRLPAATAFVKSFVAGGLSRRPRVRLASGIDGSANVTMMITSTHNPPITLHLLPRNDAGKCSEVLEKVYQRAKELGVVSLDTEWQPELAAHEHNKVSLLQLGLGNDVFLLQLLHLSGPPPPVLHTLLADPHIVKVGCSIKTDVKRLRSDYGLETASPLDLRDAAHAVGLVHLKKMGLTKLTKEFLGFGLDKSEQRSDWGNVDLSKEQLYYAALDAWSGYGIIEAMFKRYGKNVGQPRDVSEFCQRLLSSRTTKARQRGEGKPKEPKPKEPKPKEPFVRIKKPTPEQQPAVLVDDTAEQSRSGPPPPPSNKTIFPSQRAAPLYDNVKLLAPDGDVLSTCSRQRADWYLARGLAVVHEEAGEKLSIRLTFEPSGRRKGDEAYEVVEKDNICVRCGAPEQHVRHHVVPRTYRKHFPRAFKSHLAHDILLLCLRCHVECDALVQERMRSLAVLFTAPFMTKDNPPVIRDDRLQKVRQSGRLLLKHGTKLPPELRDEHEQRLKDFFGRDLLTEACLKEAAELSSKSRNADFTSHGQQVVEAILREDRLEPFIREWREFFFNWVGPYHFLPQHWSINSRVCST